MAWKDYLPNLQAAKRLKEAIEQKSSEYKTLFTDHLTKWENTQKALLAIALAIFLLLIIAYFWKDGSGLVKPKYITVGIITSYLLCYVYDLTQNKNTN